MNKSEEEFSFRFDLKKKMSGNLIALAKELSRTKPGDLPQKFLQLDRRISSLYSAIFRRDFPSIDLLQRSTSITSVKHDIIALEILPILLLTLRQDFTTITNGWRLVSMNLSQLAR